MRCSRSPGTDVDALEDVHLIWTGALLGRVPDDVDDNVVVHFLEFHITKGNQWGGGRPGRLRGG